MPHLLAFLVLLIGIVFAALNRRTSRRSILIALGVTLTANLLLIILPFFAYGLHQQNLAQVTGGSFDPKGYLIFSDAFAGGWLHFIALVLLPLTPVLLVAMGIRLIGDLRQNWRQLQATTRTFAVSSVLLSSALMAFLATPLGRAIVVWHFD